MIKTRLTALLAAALIALSASLQAGQTETLPDGAAQAEAPAVAPNFFDPNYWVNGFGGANGPVSTGLTFNAAHPASWMKWVDPKTHSSMHMQFMNPATYAQFMQPQFFIEFLKPENMAAWMDMNQFQVMMDPQTMAYWTNPASYMHAFNPNLYTAAMNPANYMAYMNPATYAGWAGVQACEAKDAQQGQTWFGYAC